MKVYRGFDKEVGPISYAHWTYVTPDIEQAKYYATKDGEVEDGAIIEYDLDLDNLRFISLSKLNSFAQSESEIYSEKDLLWYQEGLGESLYKYIAGIYFTDPYNKNHIIYIVFSKENLKNGRILTPEEIDAIQLNESFDNQINEVLRLAGVELTEAVGSMVLYHATDLVTAKKIIEENEIQGATENWFEEQEKLMHGVSTSRSLKEAQYYISASALVPNSLNDDGTYFDREAHVRTNGYAVFVLDYRKLKQTHRIIPYNWFANNEPEEYFSKGEMEEFVIGDIKPLTKYLTKVMFFDNNSKLIKEKDFNKVK